MTAVLFFLAGLFAWTVSSFAAGGGSMLLAAAASLITPGRAMAPVVTVTSLIAAVVRIGLFRRLIVWRLVAWYLPGGVLGAALGGWVFAELRSDWLQVVVALFLLSAVGQYALTQRRPWRPMHPAWFVPVSIFSGIVSAVVGASGLMANPFYLSYGLDKQVLLATRAVNSLGIQLTKLASYTAFGAMTGARLLDGAAASAGAAIAIAVTTPGLRRISPERFRMLVLALLVAIGLQMLWQRRALLMVVAGIG